MTIGLALGGEAGDDQRHRGAEVGRHDLRALQALDAGDGRDLAVEMDVGAEAGELLDVHEAVLEDRLADVRGAARPRLTSAISCACRSVGKPGNGSVVTSTGGEAAAVPR